MDEINLLLQEAAEEERQAMIDIYYDAFLEEMYYWLDCSQWERDMEMYDEFG